MDITFEDYLPDIRRRAKYCASRFGVSYDDLFQDISLKVWEMIRAGCPVGQIKAHIVFVSKRAVTGKMGREKKEILTDDMSLQATVEPVDDRPDQENVVARVDSSLNDEEKRVLEMLVAPPSLEEIPEEILRTGQKGKRSFALRKVTRTLLAQLLYPMAAVTTARHRMERVLKRIQAKCSWLLQTKVVPVAKKAVEPHQESSEVFAQASFVDQIVEVVQKAGKSVKSYFEDFFCNSPAPMWEKSVDEYSDVPLVIWEEFSPIWKRLLRLLH
jgi:hypothetical protein